MRDTKRNIKFTVIIPTRERADTLRWLLKTCTSQNYDNFEIIVSDNFSRDETRQVVEAEIDSRIRYINTGKCVSMTDNFEFALRHVTGEYVCIIGDDGLLPNALQELNQPLNGNDIKAITWKKPLYFWNQWHQAERQNTMRFDLNTESKEFNLGKMLQKLLAFSRESRFYFSQLASLYHGFIKTGVLNNLRSKDGRLFHSSTKIFYLLEASRYASDYAKKFGFKNSLQKAFQRIFRTVGSTL